MKTKEEIKKWLLENCVDKNGDLDLSNLDFSDFNGEVDFSKIKVQGDLLQGGQEVQGNLHQNKQKVQGIVLQDIKKFGSIQKVYDAVTEVSDKYELICVIPHTDDFTQDSYDVIVKNNGVMGGFITWTYINDGLEHGHYNIKTYADAIEDCGKRHWSGNIDSYILAKEISKLVESMFPDNVVNVLGHSEEDMTEEYQRGSAI